MAIFGLSNNVTDACHEVLGPILSPTNLLGNSAWSGGAATKLLGASGAGPWPNAVRPYKSGKC
jgi:hypothetical protein